MPAYFYIFSSVKLLCISKRYHYGVQDDQLASLPARIVLNCQMWPGSSRMKNQPISNVSIEVQEDLCKQFDKAVIKGFSSQPLCEAIALKL